MHSFSSREYVWNIQDVHQHVIILKNDNLDLTRISNLTEMDIVRLKKYQRVLKSLTNTET